ncbi:MAG: hypothetical protein PHC88_15730 [Terrimicrobiaceae bacterium]|nr:hypothetical protein [Terrimicrobiaceae bacterium]
MKLKTTLIVAALAAAASIQVASAALQAPMPEFKSKAELQKTTQARQATKAASETGVFYTGKPLESDRNGYLFMYRSYDPELNRWTSADPSGFPDGANNRIYAPTPTCELDMLGLYRTGANYNVDGNTQFTDGAASTQAPSFFANQSAPMSQRFVQYCIDGTAATISNLEVNSFEWTTIIGSTEFTNSVRSYVGSLVQAGNGSPVTFGSSNSVAVNFTSNYDLEHSLGHVTFNLAGTISPVRENGYWTFAYPLTVSFTDPYDFQAGGNALVNVFARLQDHNWLSAFSVTGTRETTFWGGWE